MRKRTHCGRGHDLTDPANILPKAAGDECRVCKREGTQRWRAARGDRTRVICDRCGGPKKKTVAKMCDPCREHLDAVEAIEEPDPAALNQFLDDIVGAECEPPWVRKERTEARERGRSAALEELHRLDAMRRESVRGSVDGCVSTRPARPDA